MPPTPTNRGGNKSALATARAVYAAQRDARRESVIAEVGLAILTLRAHGRSLREIADALNLAGHRTQRGKAWTAWGVRNLLNCPE